MSTDRGQFNSKLGFVLAAAGSAVGLGNIWGFPFQVGKGGGAAFVLIYLLFCFILCYPLMVAEIAIGRRTKRNPVGAFIELGFRRWSIIGKLGVLSGCLILSYYNVIAGWALGYFFQMVQGNFGIGQQFAGYTADVPVVSLFSLAFMLATAIIVSGGVKNGIERAAKFLMPTLAVLMGFLVIYALTLPNAMKGLEFYLVPDFSKLSVEVVYSALGQAFFSLSLGMGTLITYGSYVSRKQNIANSAAYIILADVGIALMAGLMMFPFVFYQGLEPNGGVGLIFVALPGIFESLGPFLGVFIGSVFFLLLSFAALTSTVSLLEVPVSYLVDERRVRRKHAVWIAAGIIIVLGFPSLLANGGSDFFGSFITYLGATQTTDFMTLAIDVANNSFLPLGGCLIAIFTAYVWKKENLHLEIQEGSPGISGSLVEKYLDFALYYVCPAVLGTLFLLTILSRFFGVDLLN